MALAMMRPTKHPRSGTYRLRLAIPAHLQRWSERSAHPAENASWNDF